MGTTLHTLKPNPGATRDRKRVGRGHGSGTHKTSGRGQKGQKARTGHHGLPKPGFEGGQTMLARRLPKRGFTNDRFRRDVYALNVGAINRVFDAGEVADLDALKERGLVPRSAEIVKILAKGEIKRAVTIRAHLFSAAARGKITAAGGSVEEIPLRPTFRPRRKVDGSGATDKKTAG